MNICVAAKAAAGAATFIGGPRLECQHFNTNNGTTAECKNG